MADTVLPIPDSAQAAAQRQAVQATQPTQIPTAPNQDTTAASQNTTAAKPGTDTVQLSETARVAVLEQQGLTVSEIAAQLGIPQATVQSDLGVVQNTQQAADTIQPKGSAASAYSTVPAA